MTHHLLALVRKELAVFFKDLGSVVVSFLMPFLFILLMSFALEGQFEAREGRRVPCLVVDQDQGPAARALLTELAKIPSLRLEPKWGGRPIARERAEALIANGRRQLALMLPVGLSAAATGPAPGEGPVPRVEIVVDPALANQFVRPLVAALRGAVDRVVIARRLPAIIEQFIPVQIPVFDAVARQEISGAIGRAIDEMGTSGKRSVVQVERRGPRGAAQVLVPSTYQQTVPAYTIFGIFWVVSLLATSVLQERRDGTFRRLLISPMRPATILAGKLVAYFLVNLLQIAVMLGAAGLCFGLDLGDSTSALIVVSIAVSAAATGLGALVASIARTQAQAGGITILLLLSLAILGGCFVPSFVMPGWMREIGHFTPHAWALDAYQDILVRGAGLSAVLPKVGVLLGFAAAFFAAGVWSFRFERR